MNKEIKFAKYLTDESIVKFLESTGRVRVNKNKKPHIKAGKHEIIVVGVALVEKYKSNEHAKAVEFKESNFMCVFDDFKFKLTMAGNSTMNHCRTFLFKRVYAEFLLSQLPENLKEEYIQAYNAQVTPKETEPA